MGGGSGDGRVPDIIDLYAEYQREGDENPLDRYLEEVETDFFRMTEVEEGYGMDSEPVLEMDTPGYAEDLHTKEIEPVTDTFSGGMSDDPDRSFREREEERRQQYRAEIAPAVADQVTAETMWDTALSLFDLPEERVRDRLEAYMDRFEVDLVNELEMAVVAAAEDLYTQQKDRYSGDRSRLVRDALDEVEGSVIPTFPFRDGVEHRYTGSEIDPRAIRRSLIGRLQRTVDELAGEGAAGLALLQGTAIPAATTPSGLDIAPGRFDAMRSGVGETGMRVAWNSDHPAVQDAARTALLDDLGGHITRLKQQGRGDYAERIGRLQDSYATVLDRVRTRETLAAMDRYWGTDDMPYDVYEIDDADELVRAAADLGTCRRTEAYKDWYEDLADDPFTTVLGVRREEENEWIGVARLFHMENADGDRVLGLDNLGMQYEDEHVGGPPMSSCDFARYGDALPAMGLATMAYGIENGFDYVVAAGGAEKKDKRVGGGPGDRIGVAQLYGQNGTTMHLEKRGRPMEHAYGFDQVKGEDEGYEVRLLFEDPETRIA